MRVWIALLVLPPVVALLPWSVALVRRRYAQAAGLFAAWAAAWVCLLGWAFGVGLIALVALGAGVLATTSLERRN
jgi:hypothetical protein